MSDTSSSAPSAGPSMWELAAEVDMHRKVLQGMALDLQQLRAQVGEVANLLDFVVESLSEATPEQPEEPADVQGA